VIVSDCGRATLHSSRLYVSLPMRSIEVQEPLLRVGDTLGEGELIDEQYFLVQSDVNRTDNTSSRLGQHPSNIVLGGHRL
jgi:hypothetical protein